MSSSSQDILYLPALWYHRVSQKGPTVAVNYWHDMRFDHKYVYYRFLQSLARRYHDARGLNPLLNLAVKEAPAAVEREREQEKGEAGAAR